MHEYSSLPAMTGTKLNAQKVIPTEAKHKTDRSSSPGCTLSPKPISVQSMYQQLADVYLSSVFTSAVMFTSTKKQSSLIFCLGT